MSAAQLVKHLIRAALRLISHPMVCSKWMSSTDAVIQEQPACLSAGRGEITQIFSWWAQSHIASLKKA